MVRRVSTSFAAASSLFISQVLSCSYDGVVSSMDLNKYVSDALVAGDDQYTGMDCDNAGAVLYVGGMGFSRRCCR